MDQLIDYSFVSLQHNQTDPDEGNGVDHDPLNTGDGDDARSGGRREPKNR